MKSFAHFDIFDIHNSIILLCCFGVSDTVGPSKSMKGAIYERFQIIALT